MLPNIHSDKALSCICRTLFEEWAVWQQKSEAGCQRFAGELAGLGGDLDSLHQHVGHMGVTLEDRAALVAYNEAQEVGCDALLHCSKYVAL